MKKIIIFLLLAILSFASDTINLQLKWKNSFQFAGFYMAKEKNYYKKAGLDVNFYEFHSGLDVVDEVLKKKNYYGILDSSLFYWALKDKKIELLMPIFDHSPLCLVSTNMSVKTLKDIEKKNIAIDGYSFTSLPIIAMLKSQYVNLNKLKTNITLYSIKNLLTKKGVYGIYETDERYYLDEKKINYKIFKPRDYGFDFYGDILFTSQRELKNHPKKVKRFMDASKKGWNYAFNHIDETIKVILKKYNTQDLTYDKLEYEANKMKKFMSQKFEFNNDKINNIKNIYVLLGMVNAKVDIHSFIYSPCELTCAEKKFIKSHILKCILTTSWAPFNTLKDGKLTGITIDYWNIIKKRLNLRSQCETSDNWSDLLQKIKNKRADITLATTNTPDREKYAVFSKPYTNYPIVIATKNNIGFISNIKYLKDRKIAVGKNYTVEELLKKNYPSMQIIETKNIKEALTMVSDGKVFAALDILPVIAYHINKNNFTNLKIAGKTPWNFNVKFMIRKDYKILLPAINNAIDSINEDEKMAINNKWISVLYQSGHSTKEIVNIILIALIILLIILGWVINLKKEIRKRKKLELELERLATVDILTSINNRYKMDLTLYEQIEISKRYKRPLSLIYFDIDFFKLVNDNYGHKIGDLALIELSDLVLSSLRKSDVFGRWGGEEFLIILPETMLSEAVALSQKLKTTIENHNFSTIKKLTCSFGVINYEENDSVETLMNRVDKKLYKAKQNGRNRVEF